MGWRNLPRFAWAGGTRKKVLVVCLVGARLLLRPEKKHDRYYDRKKKVLVVCLAGARLLLRPEKEKVLVVCLAGARSLLRPENKKVLVVCLAGARLLLFLTRVRFTRNHPIFTRN